MSSFKEFSLEIVYKSPNAQYMWERYKTRCINFIKTKELIADLLLEFINNYLDPIEENWTKLQFLDCPPGDGYGLSALWSMIDETFHYLDGFAYRTSSRLGLKEFQRFKRVWNSVHKPLDSFRPDLSFALDLLQSLNGPRPYGYEDKNGKWVKSPNHPANPTSLPTQGPALASPTRDQADKRLHHDLVTDSGNTLWKVPKGNPIPIQERMEDLVNAYLTREILSFDLAKDIVNPSEFGTKLRGYIKKAKKAGYPITRDVNGKMVDKATRVFRFTFPPISSFEDNNNPKDKNPLKTRKKHH